MNTVAALWSYLRASPWWLRGLWSLTVLDVRVGWWASEHCGRWALFGMALMPVAMAAMMIHQRWIGALAEDDEDDEDDEEDDPASEGR